MLLCQKLTQLTAMTHLKSSTFVLFGFLFSFFGKNGRILAPDDSQNFFLQEKYSFYVIKYLLGQKSL